MWAGQKKHRMNTKHLCYHRENLHKEQDGISVPKAGNALVKGICWYPVDWLESENLFCSGTSFGVSDISGLTESFSKHLLSF